jgi:hypothetical protein
MMKDELERIWKVWVMAYFGVPSRNFPGWTEENDEKASVRIAGVPVEIRPGHPPPPRIYRCTNPPHSSNVEGDDRYICHPMTYFVIEQDITAIAGATFVLEIRDSNSYQAGETCSPIKFLSTFRRKHQNVSDLRKVLYRLEGRRLGQINQIAASRAVQNTALSRARFLYSHRSSDTLYFIRSLIIHSFVLR